MKYVCLLSLTISQVQATYYGGVTPQTDISMDQLNFTLSSLPIPSCQAGLYSWVVNVRLQCIYRGRGLTIYSFPQIVNCKPKHRPEFLVFA